MKRFSALLAVAFSRWGFMAFTVFYALFFVSFLNMLSAQQVQGLVEFVRPYYEPLRWMSMLGHILILAICVKIFRSFFAYKRFVLKRKTLGFIFALSLLELVSFFCYANVPTEMARMAENSPYYALFWTYNGYIVELVALCCTGYLLAFYVGALARTKFKLDIVLAPKKPKK